MNTVQCVTHNRAFLEMLHWKIISILIMNFIIHKNLLHYFHNSSIDAYKVCVGPNIYNYHYECL